MPALVRFILKSAGIGATIGVGLALLLVLTNAAGMGTLIRESSDPLSPMLLLVLGFSTLIGSLYTGAAIMMLPRDARDALWRDLQDR